MDYIHSSLVLEIINNKFVVSYCCNDFSSFFFSSVLRPLFDEEEACGQLIISEVQSTDKLPKGCKICLVVHTPEDLLTGTANSGKDTNQFAQDLLFSMRETESEKGAVPIVHLSLIDNFKSSLFSKATPPKSLPRSYPIMDSSIWNHLVFINDNIRYFKINLYRALKRIYYNYERGYYSLEVACEFADLNNRLLKNAYLTGTHAKGVSPFIFHSETRVKKAVQPLLKSIKAQKEKLKWRFLLLDDKVKNNKNSSECYLTKTDGKPSNKTKTDIILDRLTELGFSCVDSWKNTSVNPTCDIELVYVDTVQGAIDLMKEKEFDIILLDYLLKDDYGYSLLKAVEGKNSRIIKGPHDELFFMFISAFTTAVSERLTFEGYSRNMNWHIGEGACPTNTPELFKYRLLQLMNSRLKQTCIPDLSYESILNDIKTIFAPIKEGRTERIESVRKRAYKAYKKILGYHYDFFMLKMDEGKSLLVDSFMSDKDHMDALLEHLLQFVHLTAFGTVRQWPEIWEEYQFCVRSLELSDSSDYYKDVSEVSGYIEKHIFDLKSN